MAKLTKREYRNLAKRAGNRGWGRSNAVKKYFDPETNTLPVHTVPERGKGQKVFPKGALQIPMGYGKSTIDHKKSVDRPTSMAELPSTAPTPVEDVNIMTDPLDVTAAEELLTGLGDQEDSAEFENVMDTMIDEEIINGGL